jgi:hypothetical protein
MREKCGDPCPGSCGYNAECNVVNHTPMCTCIQGYTGDPFTECRIAPKPGSYIHTHHTFKKYIIDYYFAFLLQ